MSQIAKGLEESGNVMVIRYKEHQFMLQSMTATYHKLWWKDPVSENTTLLSTLIDDAGIVGLKLAMDIAISDKLVELGIKIYLEPEVIGGRDHIFCDQCLDRLEIFTERDRHGDRIFVIHKCRHRKPK